jgi:Secretion system C-terminal sorting domain
LVASLRRIQSIYHVVKYTHFRLNDIIARLGKIFDAKRYYLLNFLSMNRLFLSFLMAAGTLSVHSQSLGLCNQVIGSTGRTVVKQGLTHSYTVGEAVIFTLRKSTVDIVLTQGFHQPDLCPVVSTNEAADLAGWEVQVYPNPAMDLLQVHFSSEKGAALRATVVDLLGRSILTNQVLPAGDAGSIDCSSWEPGVYFLQLNDPESSAAATLRFIKL